MRTLVIPGWLEEQYFKGLLSDRAFCFDSIESEGYLIMHVAMFGIIALALPVQALLAASCGLGEWRSRRSLGALTGGLLVLPLGLALALIDVPLTAALILSGGAILAFIAAVLVGDWRSRTGREVSR